MKKSLILIVILALTLLVPNIIVKANVYSGEKETYYWQEVEAFGPNVYNTLVIRKNDPKASNYQNYFDYATNILQNISELSDNYFPGVGSNSKNVYYINNNPNVYIEIKKELYDIIEYSLELYELTDGYFDISIGKIIKQWKYIIDNQIMLTEVEIEQIIADIENIPIIENGIDLKIENNKYYIKILEGVEIDLGAIAKGYGVDLVYNYFESVGLKYFAIQGSQSSLKYAELNETSKNEIRIYNPVKGEIYGSIYIEKTSVTTSGDTMQNFHYNDMIIHHIISPKTKKPENFYRSLSLVHPNAGYSDALTTAMFSMDDETLRAFIDKLALNSKTKLEGYITFKFDGTINDGLENLNIQYKKPTDDPIKSAFRDWAILSAIVIIAAIGLYMFKESYQKPKKVESGEDV